MQFFQTFLSLFISACVPILIYALKRAKNDFILTVFLLENRQRFYLLGLLMLALSLGLTFIEDFRSIFSVIQFGTSTISLAVLGAMIGGLAVVSMRANKK
jgi:hypothetical protein